MKPKTSPSNYRKNPAVEVDVDYQDPRTASATREAARRAAKDAESRIKVGGKPSKKGKK